ncbi:MAG: NADH:ubiquinone reductase (Na(+)-transporting) subunit C [Bacteroidetes bacterium]|nr:MAG: NADH:ubiquinone reductase (Na(+)-transporting) subunit C [Bacteroidota bacterium]
MAFDKNGNGFTFVFATVMVVVVATLLALASINLKPFQQKNVSEEKMQNILKTINVNCSRAEAPGRFGEYVKRRVVLDYSSKVIWESEEAIDNMNKADAFNINTKKEFKALDVDERKYPVYICEKDGETYYVIPMIGSGLWGPIWGYVALESDLNTVYGASFDHDKETPGLGAEINTAEFQAQFPGEHLFDESGNFVSIKVKKGGARPEDLHGVDAITGGTITSNGVTEMLGRTLKVYESYFNTVK